MVKMIARSDDNVFLERLSAGHSVESKVASMLRSFGLDVIEGIKETRKPDYSDVDRFHDSFDMMVNGFRTEVKSKTYKFGMNVDPLFVCNFQTWLRLGSIVSVWIVVDSSGEIRWVGKRDVVFEHVVKKVTDKKRGFEYEAIAVPMKYWRPFSSIRSMFEIATKKRAEQIAMNGASS
jgi:hypothetical protein